MLIEKVCKNNVCVACVNEYDTLIEDAPTAMDVVMSAKYETGTTNVVIPKELFAEKFFVLSSGIAGEILQKFVNYRFRVAIYGDYSRYTSKPLKDFIYESNNGHDVFFTETLEQAIDKLCK